MSKYDVVDLYDHNASSYEKIVEALENDGVAAIVHATGTGKSYNAIQLAYDNKDKKVLFIASSNAIIEHVKKIIEDNPKLDLERDFPNLEFRTYQSLVKLSRKEIEDIDTDMLIIDEFHHLGAPVWGDRINKLINFHPNLKILGMTAYTVRDRGTSYERDMANPETDELFSNKVVSRYDLCDAMIDGVLPKPIYKTAYVNLMGLAKDLEEKVENLIATPEEIKKYKKILEDTKKRIHEAPGISDVVKSNLKKDGKYIYFCPPSSLENVNDIDTIIEEVKKWFSEIGLTEDDYVIYKSTSFMGDEGVANREAFYNDKYIDEKSAKKKLRMMFAINQYNEGVHAPNVDGVIMGRNTSSDIVFFEQLGRALSVRKNTKEEFERYDKLTIAELRSLCIAKNILTDDSIQKNELIQKLNAPVVIDLTNNYDFIKELEDNLKNKVKEIKQSKNSKKRIVSLEESSFDIDVVNADIYETLKYFKERVSRNWDYWYTLAEKYYNHYGNLEVSSSFKTLNGIEYDENGYNLGSWISRNRFNKNLGNEKREKLEKIGMRFEKRDNDIEWEKKYKLAENYYNHYGNLELSSSFKTLNGIEYDENGIHLGFWIMTNRQNKKISDERREKLEKIGMRFEVKDNDAEWEKNYNLAKKYYEHYGDLEIKHRFRTNDGINEDENGVNLGKWIIFNRFNNKLSEERREKLEKIGMRFEKYSDKEWEKKYRLAKKYYEHYGHLEINKNFRTKDGINEDKNGVPLGIWINIIRQRSENINDERREKLEKIGMRFEKYSDKEWEKKYSLAEKYFNHYGDLAIKCNFRTNDGINEDKNGVYLGSWISRQRNNKNLSDEKRKKLEKIGMRFGENNYDIEWEKNYKLAQNYFNHYGNLEIKVRFRTNDGINEDKNGVNLGKWIETQRYNKKNSEERREKLEKIGMRFEEKFNDIEWEKNYKLAQNYYNHYGNLEIRSRFITNDGIKEDKNGIHLGKWISSQRSNKKLSDEKIEKLEKIGMRFEVKDNEAEWKKNYKLAEKYYEHYGDLEIKQNFRTKDGINEDKNGVPLGNWIIVNRFNNKLSEERREKLEKIGMRFENYHDKEWEKKYRLAKKYYEHYGNLEIKQSFRTNDGINEDKNGIHLGTWINSIRQRSENINDERREKLEKIGMRFEVKDNDAEWEKNCKLADKYYEHYGDLEIKRSFRTNDGINEDKNGVYLGSWISRQRNNKNLSDEKREKLEKIGMRFNDRNKEKMLKDNIIDKNNLSKLDDVHILDKKTYLEVASKINYLSSNNIKLSKDGKLHEIFTTPNNDLKEKFGIDIDTLFKDFKNKEAKVKTKGVKHE